MLPSARAPLPSTATPAPVLPVARSRCVPSPLPSSPTSPRPARPTPLPLPLPPPRPPPSMWLPRLLLADNSAAGYVPEEMLRESLVLDANEGDKGKVEADEVGCELPFWLLLLMKSGVDEGVNGFGS